MYKTLRALVCAAVLCFSYGAQAQNIANTPYSRYGLGEYNYNTGNIRNAGMANAGISAANSYQINTANPALLYYNNTTAFEIGITGELKKLESATQSQTDGNANLAALSLSVPVSKRWTSALSLRPYTNVQYEVVSTSELTPTADLTKRFKGEGGITELYFGHGIRITSGLTIGASASYLFGNILSEESTSITDPDLSGLENQEVVYSEKTKYNDLLFRAGANYRHQFSDKLFISGGAVYSFKATLDAERSASNERRTNTGSVIDNNLYADSANSSVDIPSSFSAGISVDNGSNLTFAADLYTQKWSGFRNFNGEQELVDSYRASVGAEYTPDPNSVGNYFERVTYRAGLYYGNSPYEVNNEQIKDKGFTVGATMPLGRSTVYDLYQLNTSLGYGSRGTTDNGLIKENYLQFNIGVTINSRWFIKRRLE
ncbi:hypothetical protein H8S95_10745 [Pontibacter sp. KCTC 32443]|uniref:OmpP1/FadL family transporter n=1 Tax=Pontibacter TaxID=323449 RepID=UPI00164D28BB|nr:MULTISPECIES: hypothetical protein [Pontibacter]MBC5774538.1 hypothetical protein [Pontibacter sp. KCTC 32443]